MSGLFAEIHRTSQALAAQSQGIYTAGRNMANVNNPAYARQRVQLGDLGMIETSLGPQSMGVSVLALENVRDSLLDRQVLRESSIAAAFRAEAEGYQKAGLALGQQIDRQGDAQFIDGATATGSTHGIGEALNDLVNSFSSLAASPRSDAERQVLMQKAKTFVNRMQTVDKRLAGVGKDLNENILLDVKGVNSLLTKIASLNEQIGRFEIGNPGAALDLRDQRQAKLEALSKFIDFEVQEVAGSAGQIQIFSQQADGTPVMLLDKSIPPPALTFNGTTLVGGSPSVALSLGSGSISGHLAARDGPFSSMRGDLDTFAAQLVASFNAVYNPGGAATNFFASAGTTAGTIALEGTLTASNIRSTNTIDPGANDVALAISDLANQEFSIGGGDLIDGTFSSFYRGIVSNIANATSSAQGRFEDQLTLQRLVSERRDAVSGVSLDEEMTDLIKYQRAFDASAKVMRVMDEMLDVIVNQLIR